MNKHLLLRDNLSDTGQIPSPGYTYSCPDLITHTQVADPQKYFKDSYGRDVSMSLETGSSSNFIYARVKNIGTEPVQAYIHCYACLSALFLKPSLWKDKPLRSVSGNTYVKTGTIQPGEIGVAKEPFLFNAQSGESYCHTGYVMDSDAAPDFSPEFEEYDCYVAWIHGSPHASCRNHTRIRTQASGYEQLDQFSNPSSTPRLGVFLITAPANLPKGTRIVVKCEPVGINKEEIVSNSTQALQFSVSGAFPPFFDGVLRTAVYLPTGQKWPTGGKIVVQAWANAEENSVAAPWAMQPNSHPVLGLALEEAQPRKFARQIPVGLLIPLGVCSTEFV